MTSDFSSKNTIERARAVEATFRVKPGLYLVGSLERGVTVYNQQLRSHNLVWALWELYKRREIAINRVAVVGGGITGLTAAACFLSRLPDVSITLFERLWDFCPLQQGADNRWLHPRIYGWPADGSRAPGASLPVLNWSEGRASDVARTVVGEFSQFCKAFDPSCNRLAALLGLRHFRIHAAENRIEWIGTKAERSGAFFQLSEAEGTAAHFDTIVLATGFGLETVSVDYPTTSYWRNEQIGQPLLDGTRDNFIVSGFGDGALIDLCRLTIERYRQDTIIYELFPQDLETMEDKLTKALDEKGRAANLFDLFCEFEADPIFSRARLELSNRIRKDTRVGLHIAGKNRDMKSFSQIFGPFSSFLNRMLLFLLYRCGAFSIYFDDLKAAVRTHSAVPQNVFCRYGPDSLAHLRAIFNDVCILDERLTELSRSQHQEPKRFWEPGCFRHYSDPREDR
jgi:hypothetical protein